MQRLSDTFYQIHLLTFYTICIIICVHALCIYIFCFLFIIYNILNHLRLSHTSKFCTSECFMCMYRLPEN